MKYRSEVDGLRSLAVLPVILFHAGFKGFSGGFVGVDIFFVISGYLITTILIEELENDKFSIVNFYERRARRILPALSFIMLLCIPLAWMLMPLENHKEFLHSLVAVSLFASNLLFWMESGYFEAASEEKPLLHTWSLAVEEQYYLLFPIFLFVFWRFGKNRVFIVILLMSVASLLLAEWGWRNNPSMNFFLAPFRVWELFAGSLVAFVIKRGGVRSGNLLALTGLLCLLYATFFFDKFTPFPSVYTLVPVGGTVLIILYSGQGTVVNHLLSTRLLVGIGLISYSAYLWHQPIFAFSRMVSAVPFSHFEMLMLSVISIGLAYLSWRYIEAPFRRKDVMGRKAIFMASGAMLAVFITYGIAGSRFAEYLDSGQYNDYEQFSLTDSQVSNRDLRAASWETIKTRDESALWFEPDSMKTNVLIIGNSHSKDVFNALEASDYAQSRFAFARKAVLKLNTERVRAISHLPNFDAADVIMIASRYHIDDVKALEAIIEFIQNTGKQVVVVKNVHEFPEYRTRKWTLADYVGYSMKQHHPDIADEALSRVINQAYYDAFKNQDYAERVDFDGQVSIINQGLEKLAFNYPELVLLDRMMYICDEAVASCEAVSPALEKYFYDYGHNTIAGARRYGEIMSEVNWLKPLAERH